MGLMESVTGLARKVGLKSKDRHATFEDVEQAFLANHQDADTSFLRRAHDFAEKAHEGQTRKSGEPYFLHPVAVAHILAECKLDMETVAAGFLHDVVEDCDIEPSQIASEFSPDLAKIVDGVTKIGKVKFRDKNQAQAENYRKMILAMSEDPRVLVVKLADRTHNMQTLHHLPEEKRRRISQETMDIYVPLAHRIGMSNVKNELENLAFLYLEPEAYEDLARQLSERSNRNLNFIENIEGRLNAILEEHNISATVSSRIKSHYSIWRKMKRKQTALEGLYDYYAFRILTNTVEDCYRIFGLLHGKWRHIPGRIKDFIATPKPNLYQSIHTTLLSEQGQPFEIQVRTFYMHRLAEEGVAAHWTYKNGRLLSVGKNQFVAWLKKIADEQKDVEDTDEFLESVKGSLQTEEILVFTPASEIKTLPKGATPLDFAYHIHTEVGNHAVGAKVDGKMVPLRSELQSGSIVEIITNPTQSPNEEWLTIVKSPSAKAKIRAYLRAVERTKAIDMGRNIFEKELKRRKVPLKSVTKDALLSKLPEFNLKKIEDFYSAVGFGRITPTKAVRPFLPEGADENPSGEEVRQSRIQRAIQRISRKSKHNVLVRGHNDLLVHLAQCCNPILGDPIVGYITQGKGIAVHKKDCKSFLGQNVNPERKIEVDWDPEAEAQVFEVHIRVFTEERPGMIADVSLAIAGSQTNVQTLKAKVDQENSMGIFDIVMQIKTLGHFEKVISGLKRVKGFLDYERVR